MGQAVLTLTDLPDTALEAAAHFYALWSAQARDLLAGECTALALVFPQAAYDHNLWRRSAVADLARLAAPKRVNGVAGSDEEAIVATLDWLAQAEGITGQLLPVVGGGARGATLGG